MEILTINLKELRHTYNTAIVITILMTGFAFYAGINYLGIVLMSYNPIGDVICVGVFVLITLVYFVIYQRMTKKFRAITDLDEKAAQYASIYKLRIWWKVIRCLFMCVYHLLSGLSLMLYVALFIIFLTIAAFPNRALIRKEMQTDEILFVEE